MPKITTSKAAANVTGRAPLYTVSGALGIWMFFAGFQWALYLLNSALATNNVNIFNEVWWIVAGAATIVLSLYQRPRILTLSSLRMGWLDAAIAVAVAYVDVNVSYLLMKLPVDTSLGTLRHMVLGIAIVPVIEELICRGVILRSLVGQMNGLIAIVTSSAVIAVFHGNFAISFIAQALISAVYLGRGRSLAASLTCHILVNTLAWLPNLLPAAHWRHML